MPSGALPDSTPSVLLQLITAVRAHTRVVVLGDERRERAERLLRNAERYCVVLGTLRAGVPVESTFTLESR
jgi:uncharacterized OsmC-like protein